MKFNIEHYSDGIKSKYSNYYGLDLENAVEELIYYDSISEKYTEEELIILLPKIKDYQTFGSQWSEIRVTKNNLK